MTWKLIIGFRRLLTNLDSRKYLRLQVCTRPSLAHSLSHPVSFRPHYKHPYFQRNTHNSTASSTMTSTPNSNPAALHHNVIPSEVGWQFVPQYYTFVNKQPNRLHCFYTKSSTFIHGTEGEDGKPCYGQQVRISTRSDPTISFTNYPYRKFTTRSPQSASRTVKSSSTR